MIAERQIAFGRGAKKKEEPPAYWGLCFTAEEAGSTVAMKATKMSGSTLPAVTLETSYDGEIWEPFYVDETTITLPNVGDKVYFRAGEGGNVRFAYATSVFSGISRNTFVLTGLIAASGSIQSLLNGVEETYTVDTCAFAFLFSQCASLTSAPRLPASKIDRQSYMCMFINCDSLTVIPELVALPHGKACCRQMFSSCDNLKRIKVLWHSFPPNINSNEGYSYNWLYGVSPTGTFICPTALGTNETITRGASYCPEGWTVINED